MRRRRQPNAKWTDPREELQKAALDRIRSQRYYEYHHRPPAREWLRVKEPNALRFSRDPDMTLSAGTEQAGRSCLEPTPVAETSLIRTKTPAWLARSPCLGRRPASCGEPRSPKRCEWVSAMRMPWGSPLGRKIWVDLGVWLMLGLLRGPNSAHRSGR